MECCTLAGTLKLAASAIRPEILLNYHINFRHNMAAVLFHIHIRKMIMQNERTETKTKSSLEIWLRLHNFA